MTGLWLVADDIKAEADAWDTAVPFPGARQDAPDDDDDKWEEEDDKWEEDDDLDELEGE
jgi:hypothetical protein